MKIAVLQMEPARDGADGNFAKIERAAVSAAAFGATLLVTPELSLTGYARGAELSDLAEPGDGPIIARLSAIARQHGLAIIAGFPERKIDMVFNSAVFVQPDGQMQIYRKCHLYGPAEKAVFTASDQPPFVFAYQGMTIGMLICFDVEFAETVRGLALAGAELVIVPTALPKTADSLRISSQMIPTRAFENHVFLAYADLCGTENGLAYFGGSVIAGPDGNDLARAGATETLLVTTIDASLLDTARRENPYLDARRPHLYQTLQNCR